jgi:Chalcone isomerase-like
MKSTRPLLSYQAFTQEWAAKTRLWLISLTILLHAIQTNSNIIDTASFLGRRELIGVADYVEFKKTIYQASLYCGQQEAISLPAKECLHKLENEIVMKFVLKKRLTSRRLWALWQEGLLRNSSSDEAEDQSNNIALLQNLIARPIKTPEDLLNSHNDNHNDNEGIKTITNTLTDLPSQSKTIYEAGDQFIFYFLPERGIVIYWNTLSIGYIEGNELIQMLLQVWLGDRPPSSNFKNSLLGTGKVDWESASVKSLRSEMSEDRIERTRSTLSNDRKRIALINQLQANIESVKAERQVRVQEQERKQRLRKELEQQQKEQQALEAAQLANAIREEKVKELKQKRKQQDQLRDLHISQLKKEIINRFSTDEVQQHLRKSKQFGVVGFNISINREGRIDTISIEKTPGYNALNEQERNKQDKLNQLIHRVVKEFTALAKMPDELESASVTVPIWMNIKLQG